MTTSIVPCSALLIALAMANGRFTPSVSAGGGSTTTQAETWSGTLGGNSSQADGVSSTGAVIVGYASNAAGSYRAFRWTAAGGLQDLGTFGGFSSGAFGVSADGSVVVRKNLLHR